MNSQQFKKIKLPNTSGVYFFYKGKEILYIGKATFLKDRTKSYFGKDLINTRGLAILDMVTQSTSIKWQQTDSVLEALILEANLIKKYQPKYNTKEKDNKSFNYVCITKPARPHDGSWAGGEDLPRVLIIRGRNIFPNQYANSESVPAPIYGLSAKNLHIVEGKYTAVYGPFPNGMQLKEAMKIIRPIFPYLDDDSNKKNNKEFYRQLGLIPIIRETKQKHKNFSRLTLKGSDTDKNFNVSALSEYKKNIRNLKLFFEGKKKSVILNLKKEMYVYAKKKEFEKAGIIKKKIFALNHINDVALIKEEVISPQHISGSNRLSLPRPTGSARAHTYDSHQTYVGAKFKQNFRIEAYDIAHLAGSNMVGVMTVIENGELEKNEYRKFIIRTQDKSNDTGALEEVLSRRLRHTEWGLPSLVVMDGGVAQINVAKAVLNRYQFKIPVVSVVKDDKHKAKAIMGDEEIIKKYKKNILLINSEAHRFAITFHKKRRNINFFK